MKLFFSIILLVGFNNLLCAQDFMWGAELEGGISWTNAMTVDTEGNVYMAITYVEEVDFNPNGGEYTLDGGAEGNTAIQKLDVNRNLEWVSVFESMTVDGIIGNNLDVQAIEVGDNGAIYLTGSFSGSVDFDPGAGVVSKDAGISNSDIFVLKLDQSGNYDWVQTFGNVCHDAAKDLVIDESGNICIIGTFCQTIDFDPGADVYELESVGEMGEGDIFILKLSEDGAFIWANAIASVGFDEANAITSDSDNNYFIGGGFSVEADFNCGEDEHMVTAAGTKDAFLLKLDESGEFVWAKTIEGAAYATITSIDLDLDENLYVAGDFYGDNIDFDLGDGIYEMSATLADIFILKLNDSDEFQWAKQLGGAGYDREASIEISAVNTIYIVGMYSDEIDVDPGADTHFLTHDDTGTGTSDDFFIANLNPDGTFIKALGFTGSRSDYCRDVKTGPEGSIYMSGHVQSGVDIDPSGDEFVIDGDLYNSVTYILKLQDGVLSVDEDQANSNFTVYPNPTTSQFNILLEENQANVTVEIMDITGRVIDQYVDQNTAFIQMELNAPKGVYFVRVSTAAGKRVVKLIKN